MMYTYARRGARKLNKIQSSPEHGHALVETFLPVFFRENCSVVYVSDSAYHLKTNSNKLKYLYYNQLLCERRLDFCSTNLTSQIFFKTFQKF